MRYDDDDDGKNGHRDSSFQIVNIYILEVFEGFLIWSGIKSIQYYLFQLYTT